MDNATKHLSQMILCLFVGVHLYLFWMGQTNPDYLKLFVWSVPIWICWALEGDKRTSFVWWFIGTHLAYFLFSFAKMPAEQAAQIALLTPVPLATAIALVRVCLKSIF